MKDVITGYTEIHGTNFIFYLSDFLLTLVPATGEIPREFIFKQTTIEVQKGLTSNNHEICFLHLSFYGGFINQSITAYIAAYVLGKNNLRLCEIDFFSELIFSGGVVDKYFSPSRKLDMQKIFEERGNNAETIYMRPQEDIDFIADVDTHLKMKFSVAGPSLPGQYSGEIGNLKSNFSLSTDTKWRLDNLLDLYRSVYHLFAFFNFRRNITFDEIILSKRNDDDKLEPIGTLFIVSKYPCTNVHAMKTIVHSEIQGKIVKLYSCLNDLEKHLSFIPENDDEAHILDYSTYMQTCAVFEGVFDMNYGNINVKDNSPAHLKVKKQIVLFIQSIISNSPDDLKSEAQSYLDIIQKDDEKTLKAQFANVLRANKNILEQVFPKIRFNSNKINSIAFDFANQRNLLDHGAYARIPILSVTPYTFAICLIYIMILGSIGIEEESITRIIKKIFENYNHES